MIKCLSLFSQILSEISLCTVSFEQLVMKHGIDHRDNIQRTTGDRVFFQDTETDIKRKDIYRDK